mmetsp:Transcript_95753/g.166357  ORF Transcript_95753/g.166357 Transcript_95753/m.166357 type:complete len:398 (+) Transcript_95753:83-1276(+)
MASPKPAAPADAPAREALPVNFGKRLAHTDKPVRDRGFKTLKKWLQKHHDLERLEYMKLWKGLYFGMWMADKRLVQQELAVNTALLLNDVPVLKQAMWIDTFWETMQAHWEKLDIHRISKFLLFVRIIVAEAFKAVRLSGWQIAEVRTLSQTFTRRIPKSAQEGPNAPSLGLLLQFTRIFWDEIQPQLEAKPRASKKAVLELLEPFCVLAEGSTIDSLVRSIHEHILRKAPHELLNPLTARVLDGAGKESVRKGNRQALYDTADALESRARQPRPESASSLELLEEAAAASATSSSSSGAAAAAKAAAGEEAAAETLQGPPSPFLLPPACKSPASGLKKVKKKRKRTANETAGADSATAANGIDETDAPVSPLMLPKAALPLENAGRKAKKKRRRLE